jgi:hypothetical protein
MAIILGVILPRFVMDTAMLVLTELENFDNIT